jgi:hypothetical protein
MLSEKFELILKQKDLKHFIATFCSACERYSFTESEGSSSLQDELLSRK